LDFIDSKFLKNDFSYSLNAALHGARPKGALRCKRQLGIAYSARNYHRRYWTTMPVYPEAPSD
jgi:hypothetical protein